MIRKQKQLFKTRIVPGKKGSGKLFEEEFVVDDGPVECLGMTFENDEERREYFLEKLREKLKDPEFRKIEGFPIGEDEDILALSDTAVQARFAEELASYLEPVPESATPGDWGPVYGELLTFDDPESRLPAIDRLDGFHPGEWSLYSRVLVPVHARERIVLAWLYIGGQQVEGRIVRTNISS